MSPDGKGRIAAILDKHEKELLAQWKERQLASTATRRDLIDAAELGEQSQQFVRLLRDATSAGGVDDIDGPAWRPVRELLATISVSRARQGFTPSETAMFVFSLKEPLFARLRQDLGADATALAEETWNVSLLLDKLGLYTTEVYQKGRDEVVARQQLEMLELSTPVVQLWEGVLGLPVIGTLDSARTQVVMETLLQRIVETGAQIAIIDITGVPTVDTLVAQHLLKTVAAARLMGADCIISGIRPQIAQTIVSPGRRAQQRGDEGDPRRRLCPRPQAHRAHRRARAGRILIPSWTASRSSRWASSSWSRSRLTCTTDSPWPCRTTSPTGS
jgi:rsbT co-antagonist protein RsbR